MADTPAGWHEITRTRFRAGMAGFDFVDGPARGHHELDISTTGMPARYVVLQNAALTAETVYVQRPSTIRVYYEFLRDITSDWEHITCPVCGRTSYHPKYKERGWCARCNAYTHLGVRELPQLDVVAGPGVEPGAPPL